MTGGTVWTDAGCRLLDIHGVADVLKMRAHRVVDCAKQGWIPKWASVTNGRHYRWSEADVQAWADMHRDWVDETDTYARARIRLRYQGNHPGPVGGISDEFRVNARDAMEMARIRSYSCLTSLVSRGRFPQPDANNTFVRDEVDRWVAQNQDWIQAGSQPDRKRAGVFWPDPKPEAPDGEAEEEEEDLDEVEDVQMDEELDSDDEGEEMEDDVDAESDEAESEDVDDDGEDDGHPDSVQAISDPVAAIQSIAMEAIRAIRAITELQASGVEEEDEAAEDEEAEE